MESSEGVPFGLYADDGPTMETPDLTDQNSSSEHESSPSDGSEISFSPQPISSGTPVAHASADTSRRDFSTTTAIHIGNDEELSLVNDPFSDGFNLRKSSDVFSTLSDEDFDLDLHLPTGHSSSFLRSINPSTPTSLQRNRERPVFRNPSSVRAMQMSSPHPFPSPFSPSPRSARFRQSGASGTNDYSSRVGTPLRPDSSPAEARRVKKEYPLVLLHVTITPIPLPYSIEAMEEILPPWVLENYTLLREKASTTLLQRGMLIPHPRDDYELLEERVLESMELKTPRIYKCGHFDGRHECEPDATPQALPCEDFQIPDYSEEHQELFGETCDDCGKTMNSGEFGTGSGGARRWDIKIYAANGLMRAGAWAAAWAEMEKVDLEIGVWIPEASRLLLEEHRRKAEEQDEEARRDRSIIVDIETEEDIAAKSNQEEASISGPEAVPARTSRTSSRADPIRRGEQPLPLATLLQNYLLRLSTDSKNIAIAILFLIIAFTWFRPATPIEMANTPEKYHLPACTFPIGAHVSGVSIEAVEQIQESIAIATSMSSDTMVPSEKPTTILASLSVTPPAESVGGSVQVEAFTNTESTEGLNIDVNSMVSSSSSPESTVRHEL